MMLLFTTYTNKPLASQHLKDCSGRFCKAFSCSHQIVYNHRIPAQSNWRLSAPKSSSKRPLQALAMLGADGEKKTGVLFVCLGNICRSPTAEAVFKAVVDRKGISHLFDVDSCGTGGGVRNWYKKGGYSYHEGGPADERMTAAAAKRGVDLTSRSRPLHPEDLQRFDYILAMDFSNRAAIEEATNYWAGQGKEDYKEYLDRVSLMCSYQREERFKKFKEVPDPYWSDDERGFNQVLDLLEDSCEGLLEKIQANQKAK